MAALDKKENPQETKNTEEYIKQLNIKNVQEFYKSYEELDPQDLILKCMAFGMGHALYRAHSRIKSPLIELNTIIVRKVSVSGYCEDQWPRYSKIYSLMKKTKLLNYYDLYFVQENGIDYLLLTMEDLQMTLKDYVEWRYKNNGPGIAEDECKSIIKDLLISLSVLHGEGYIHTDIQPENIMVRNKKTNPEQNYDNSYFKIISVTTGLSLEEL